MFFLKKNIFLKKNPKKKKIPTKKQISAFSFEIMERFYISKSAELNFMLEFIEIHFS